MTRYASDAAYFHLRAEGYTLAAAVAEALDSLDGEDATLVREAEPMLRVEESGRSGSTYVYLDQVCSRVSDHDGGASGEASERLSAAEMVERWLDLAREED